MSSICRRIQNIPCNHVDLLTHFSAILFSLNCLKKLLHQKNSGLSQSEIKSGLSQSAFKIFPLLKPIILNHDSCVRVLITCVFCWSGLFDIISDTFFQQRFRIWIISDRIFFVQEKLGKFRDI